MFTSQQLAGGFDMIGQLGSFISAQKTAKAQRKWQNYNNQMVHLADAENQNAITANDLMRKDRKHTQLMQIQKSEMAVTASAEVAAGATGTIGNSVNATLFDIGRNAARARSAVELDDDYQDVQSQNQRMQSTMQMYKSLDLTTIPSPSPASLMLGLGKSIVNMRL